MLFAEGEPVSLKRLCMLIQCESADLTKALNELAQKLEGRGIVLVRTETEAALAVAPQGEEMVQKAQEEGVRGDIGDAGLEVLAIVLYRGASKRADIDYIRGVNSSFTIRSLLARGLLERIKNPEDSREFVYRPTVELLAHLGVREGKELPDYATILAELSRFEATKEHGNAEHTE